MSQPSPPTLSYNNRKWFQITGCQQVFVAVPVRAEDTLDASKTSSLEDIKFRGNFPGHLLAFTSSTLLLKILVLVCKLSLVDFHTELRIPNYVPCDIIIVIIL